MKNLILLFYGCCVLASCKVIEPKAPSLPPSQLPSTPLPDSKIDVPVTADLTQIFNGFNSQIPSSYSGGGSVGPGTYKWNLNRAPFNFAFNNNNVSVQDQANAYGEGDAPIVGKVCSCSVTANVTINTTFNLSPNYYLSGNAVLSQFSSSPCRLTFANLDVTPYLTQAATNGINKGLGTVNQMINQYSVIKYVQPAWNSLSQTIKIPGVGYLQLNPSAVRMETPIGSGSTLSLPLGITAKPQFYTTDPGQVQPTTLPNISDAAGGGFLVTLDADIDYATLNKVLATNVAGKRITYPKGHIDIKKIELFGVGNDHILMNVQFKGAYGLICYKGNLYFSGIPDFETGTGNFYLTNVDFDTNTTQAINDKGASWILNAVIKTFFNDQVKVNINPQIDLLKNAMDQALNTQIAPGVSMSGTVGLLIFRGALAESNALLLRITTSGNLAVSVKP